MFSWFNPPTRESLTIEIAVAEERCRVLAEFLKGTETTLYADDYLAATCKRAELKAKLALITPEEGKENS